MKTLIAGAAFGAGALLLSFAPALADTNVLCVQQELAARGYSPGPLDGQLGPATEFAARQAGIGTLTAGNAGAWCATLGPARAPQTFSYAQPYPYGQPFVYAPPYGYQQSYAYSNEPAFVQRLGPRNTFNSFAITNCPAYTIDINDPCY